MFALPFYKYSLQEVVDPVESRTDANINATTMFTRVDVGYEPNRFVNLADFSDELSCPICFGIFREPVVTACRHVFCKSCIKMWSMKSMTCPVDRRKLTMLYRPPIVVEKMINKLLIKCDYEHFGCEEIVELPLLEQHTKCCHFKPRSKLNRFFHRIFD
ncbi:E3 ubiquitin-protein ligase NRDP1-like isoform X1 [Dinothrombium tinctorium]|uniref:E3 ubiquitin-protein ligase NRDP1-like isoform X1 n=1 Tax=Dinothrombium tinctorium TaxID=1965070 RepID=A0A3S3NZZ7_9ACAR|nr:E3 ubiquitin-protein ligase NRDP1-like isoform X1 [Dinothrombium tinctorium]RWS09167.1 E3 ubiquitin-protein ligase NRDP1-like isoform X1 [Dinothrombium tinctorium]RWS09173.1 E3 ubiquitin-protein ligase NRDP1-like isoform X1 [Dinothrombium tinctorium]